MTSSMRRIAFALVVAASLVGCAPIQTLPYTANPGRITEPMAEVRAMINANVVQGCVVEIEDAARMMTVKYVCNDGIGNSVLRFDQVDTVSLQQSGDWYRVLVKHTSAEDFSWTSKSRADMERLADAVTALSSATAAP